MANLLLYRLAATTRVERELLVQASDLREGHPDRVAATDVQANPKFATDSLAFLNNEAVKAVLIGVLGQGQAEGFASSRTVHLHWRCSVQDDLAHILLNISGRGTPFQTKFRERQADGRHQD